MLGGDLEVHRLGFGAMRITGPGIWGEPGDPEGARRLLRHVVEAGVNLIDTADSYGPEVSENLIAEALYPYPDGLVIATKGGLTRAGPNQWHRNCRPERLKRCCEDSLRRLRLERIDLYQLHAVDPQVPVEDSIGALVELQQEGKIRHIGVSNASSETSSAPGRSPRSSRSRTATTSSTAAPRRCCAQPSSKRSRSCLGRLCPRVGSPNPAGRSIRSPAPSGDLGAGRDCVAAAALAGDAADSGDQLDRALRRRTRGAGARARACGGRAAGRAGLRAGWPQGRLA